MVGVKEEMLMDKYNKHEICKPMVHPTHAQHMLPYDMGYMCKKHMHRHVLVETRDGRKFDGIIEHVDEVNVYIAVIIKGMDSGYRESEDAYEASDGSDVRSNNETNQEYSRGFGYPGYGFGGYGYGYPGYGYGYPGYGYGYPGYGYGYPNYGRLILPLFGLAAISALR
jgi:small nuclear ribonucleoprotein (snRNP)-like protein